MDRSLARGHANRFLDKLTPHGSVLAWHESPHKVRALDRFAEASLFKKPGRALERLRSLLSPTFGDLHVVAWNRKAEVMVTARSVSSARESTLLHPDDRTQALFDERAAFFNNLIFRADRESARVFGATTGSIGAHAITRLLERGLAAPEMLQESVFSLLHRASVLRIGMLRAGLDHERPWGLLFPVPGGAASAVTYRIRPWPGMPSDETDAVASVRTVLRENMLTPDQRERMEDFEPIFNGDRQDPDLFPA